MKYVQGLIGAISLFISEIVEVDVNVLNVRTISS